MTTVFYKLSENFKIIPLGLLKLLSGQTIIFPFYHTVSDKEIIHIKHLYRVRSVKQFENDLDFFLKYYTPLDLKDVISNVKDHKPLKKNSFLLSFDDGLIEFHDIIVPILLKKGIPAVCFLNTGFINNKDIFYRYKASILIEELIKQTSFSEQRIKAWFQNKQLKFDAKYSSLLSINYNNQILLDELAALMGFDFQDYLKEHQPYMSDDHIEALIDKGFSFGAHSVDHPQFSDIDLNSQLIQTKDSLDYISSQFDLDYRVFSFPFTDFNVSKEYFDKVYQKESGIADLTFGCAGLKKDSYLKNIQRIPVETDYFSAKDIVTGEYLYYLAKAILNKNTIIRK